MLYAQRSDQVVLVVGHVNILQPRVDLLLNDSMRERAKS